MRSTSKKTAANPGHHGHHGARDGAGAAGLKAALTADADNVVGTDGRDLITATAATLGAGDAIDAGAGRDLLELRGAGSFDLNALASLTGVEEVRTASGVEQTIRLRDGADLRLVTGNGTYHVTTGASGAQQVVLGGGSLELAAGGATDVLVLGCSQGTASVTGFAQGTDKIDAHALRFASVEALLAAATVTSDAQGTTLVFDQGPSVTLLGVAAISAADFLI